MAYSDGPLAAPTYLDLCSIDAERAVLGGLLTFNEWQREIDPRLREDSFAVLAHQTVFAAIRDLILSGRTADGVSVSAELGTRGQLAQIGGPNFVIALLEQAALFSGQFVEYTRVICDFAIRRAIYRLGCELSERALRSEESNTPEGVQAGDRLITQAEAGLRALSSAGGAEQARTAEEAAREAIARARRVDTSGPPCGLADFDELIGGLGPGQLHILAGRPGMGKTAIGVGLALSAALAAERRNERLGAMIFSQEMSCEQLGLRMAMALADEGDLYSGMPACGSLSLLRKGRLNSDQWARLDSACARLAQLPIVIDDAAPVIAAQIEARAARQIDRWARAGVQPGLIVVDYIGLVAPETDRRGNKVLEIADISARLKGMAKRLNIHVLALCQINRGVESREEKRPTLSDLRDSGALEQDADIVTFCYREAYYLEREVYALRQAKSKTDAGVDRLIAAEAQLTRCASDLELIVAKQRQGPTGAVKILFSPATTAIRGIGRRNEET